MKRNSLGAAAVLFCAAFALTGALLGTAGCFRPRVATTANAVTAAAKKAGERAVAADPARLIFVAGFAFIVAGGGVLAFRVRRFALALLVAVAGTVGTKKMQRIRDVVFRIGERLNRGDGVD